MPRCTKVGSDVSSVNTSCKISGEIFKVASLVILTPIVYRDSLFIIFTLELVVICVLDHHHSD